MSEQRYERTMSEMKVQVEMILSTPKIKWSTKIDENKLEHYIMKRKKIIRNSDIIWLFSRTNRMPILRESWNFETN